MPPVAPSSGQAVAQLVTIHVKQRFYVFLHFSTFFIFKKVGKVQSDICHLSITITVRLNPTTAVTFCSFLLLLEAVGNV